MARAYSYDEKVAKLFKILKDKQLVTTVNIFVTLHSAQISVGICMYQLLCMTRTMFNVV